jgi:hypothetical protein
VTGSVLIAAPLLIGAIVMALRFVGCSLDTMGELTPVSYSGTVSETMGLVGFWQLDDPTSSTTAVDSVGSPPDGTNPGAYHAGVTRGAKGLLWGSGDTDASNPAADFDGVKGYVSVPFASSLNPEHFTVEAIVEPSVIDSNTHVIVASDTGYQLVLNGNAFQASIAAGGAFQTPVVVSAGATIKGGPYYVAMTYDGTNLDLYVNPAAGGGPSSLGPDAYVQGTPGHHYQPATSGELRIGASSDGGPPGEFFAGTIQDVAVYDRALGFYEIVNHWTISTSSMTPYPGGPTSSGATAVTGYLAGQGTLSATATFPTMTATTWQQEVAGNYTYPIPYWCSFIDVFLLGAGGGGSGGLPGNGGQAGNWTVKTYYRLLGPSQTPPPAGAAIGATVASIPITVGSGGTAGGGAGNPTTATVTTATPSPPLQALGGFGAANVGPDGAGPGQSPALAGTTFAGGATQTTESAAGNSPGGGGAGGYLSGGAGADGAAFIIARQ